MFYFSGCVNGKYLKHEVKQLSLLLSRVKYRPLVWRNTHPYIVVDRYEDVTHPSKMEEDERCERSVVFCGYVRGSNLKQGQKVHLVGVGDYGMAEVGVLEDPVPVAGKEKDSTMVSGFAVVVLPCLALPCFLQPLQYSTCCLTSSFSPDTQQKRDQAIRALFQCRIGLI